MVGRTLSEAETSPGVYWPRMRNGMRYGLILAALGGLAGCGDDDKSPGTLVDCDWLATEANCWRTGLGEAQACFGEPVDSTSGTFNATRDVCTYPDGRSVSFAAPVPQDIPDDYLWDFRARDAAGNQCVRFRDIGQTGYGLDTASGEVVMGSGGGLDLLLTCPSGDAYRIGFEEAFSCLLEGPGYSYSASGGFLYFNVLGGADEVGSFVNCQDPGITP